MKRYSGGYLRIAFFISRSTKLTQDWFRGTMLYTRHNPKWFVRVFELGNGITEELLDFGSIRPDGISVRTLQVHFKEAPVTGSVLDEIRRVQLEYVCRLLKTTSRSISEIAYISGFGSLSRLQAVFHETFGMSMRDYRQTRETDGFDVSAAGRTARG